jgi:hypothetical protein
LDTSELEESLDGWGCDETSTTWCWNKLETLDRVKDLEIKITYSDSDGTALPTLLGWQRMRLTEVRTPVSSSDWNDGELRNDDSSTNGSSNFLGGLDSKTNVSLGVSNNDDGLETGTLTGTGLLLHRLDLFHISL